MKTQARSGKAGMAKNHARSEPGSRAVTLSRVEHTALALRRVPDINASRCAQIAEAACYRAEKRDFVPGYELEDWLAAEQEFDEKSRRL